MIKSRAGGSPASHTDQSTPSLKTPTGQDALEDQQDSVYEEARLNSGATKSSEINHSNSSLKVPVRDISDQVLITIVDDTLKGRTINPYLPHRWLKLKHL